jgi:hypothetical protein
MLGALSTHLVVAEAANEVENGPSGATDSTRDGADSGVLEGLKGGVCLEGLREMLDTLITRLVVAEAANEGAIGASGGAGSRKGRCSAVLECLERCIDLECLRDIHCALLTEAVVAKAANEEQIKVSWGTDTFVSGREAAYSSFTSTEFFRRSKASKMASPAFKCWFRKLRSVSSGLMPQRVVSCGLSLATSTMARAPSSPMLFRSKLPTREQSRCQRRQRLLTVGMGRYEWQT